MTRSPAQTPPPAEVILDKVTKAYRLGDDSALRAADNVSLTIRPGQRTALVGASGSGKSTLLHLIGAIDTPDSGTITVAGQIITSLSRRARADYRSTIGFVFQQFHLLPALTALENITLPLAGRGDRFGQDRARDLLDAVGLANRAGSLPSQLSGGQQQRVAIARALVVQPRLLLADEPTGNLDSTTATEIVTLLWELHARLSTTIILATHDQALANTCDDVVQVHDGRVLPYDAPPDDR